MNHRLNVSAFLAGIVLLSAGAAQAVNITIEDKETATTNSWYNNPNEDNEVEPYCVIAQAWDLEGFYLNGTTLTMVGGYNFKSPPSTTDGVPGDIFIDINGDAKFGHNNASTSLTYPNKDTKNIFGYEYVIDIDYVLGNYKVYSINEDSVVKTTYYSGNYESNPWAYSPVNTDVAIDSGQVFFNTYTSGSAAEAAGYTDENGKRLLGIYNNSGHYYDTHYALSVDIGFLDPGTTFISHYTPQCGNDNLMGQGTTVPEPGTFLLLGGLLMMSLPAVRRFRLS